MSVDDWSIEEIQLADQYRDEPVERFILEIADPEMFDEDAHERLEKAFRHVCSRMDVPLVIYEARSASVLIGVTNPTVAPLVKIYHVLKSRVPTEYEQLIDREQRKSRTPLDLAPLSWGGVTYLGRGDDDYREEPPSIPSDDELRHTPFPELQRLSMAHGLLSNKREKRVLIEQLQEARVEPEPGFAGRVKDAVVGTKQ